jgi:signal transduction histidine kinase
MIGLTTLLGAFLAHSYPAMIRITHYAAFTAFSITCIVAGIAQLRRGLSPFDQLRSRLGAVRDGRDRRLEGTYPSEVEPLVADLNDLLEHREKAVTRAVAKAGDLAHGLKTPLAVLSQEAERARVEGHLELADAIGVQVERMKRQIDYHLAHARAAASGARTGARCAVATSVDGLVRTMGRLYAERHLTIVANVASDHVVRVEREDLDEMLGNLLDNACKWTVSQVVVTSASQNGRITITIDDDGPGLAPPLRTAVLERGVRADEAAPGSGFGLAIVHDLAEVYGGSIALDATPAGGLRARLELPAATA